MTFCFGANNNKHQHSGSGLSIKHKRMQRFVWWQTFSCGNATAAANRCCVYINDEFVFSITIVSRRHNVFRHLFKNDLPHPNSIIPSSRHGFLIFRNPIFRAVARRRSTTRNHHQKFDGKLMEYSGLLYAMRLVILAFPPGIYKWNDFGFIWLVLMWKIKHLKEAAI